MTLLSARSVANAAMFQLTWLVCVQGNTLWALVATVIAMSLHWRFAVRNPREWQLWLLALVLGFFVDTALIALGVLRFSATTLWPPLWLSCLWPAFAMTLLHSVAFLQRSLPLSAALGAVGGPLAYYGGTQFAGVGLGITGVPWSPLLAALLVLAVCWALVTPLLVMVARHLETVRHRKDAL